MSSTYPIAILNGTFFFPTAQLQVHNENQVTYGRNLLSAGKPEH